MLKVLFIIGQNGKWYVHNIQQLRCNLPLQLMLRMIGLAIPLSPPTDEQQHRHRIHALVRKAYQGIERIAHAAVLHIDQRNFPAGKIMPGRNSYGVPFVCRNDVPLSAIRQSMVAETIQVGIRNPRKEGYAIPLQNLKHPELI